MDRRSGDPRRDRPLRRWSCRGRRQAGRRPRRDPRRVRVRRHPRPRQRPPPPAADRVPHAARHARRADARLAAARWPPPTPRSAWTPSWHAPRRPAGLAEALLCGVTTVADHHLTWPAGADGARRRAGDADGRAPSSGARLVFVRGSARDDPAGRGGVRRRDRGGARGGARDGMLQLAVGPAGRAQRRPRDVRGCSARSPPGTACGGGRRRTSRSTSRSPLERYGRRPLDLLDEWGWLAPDVTLAHLCGVTDDEIARLAAAGVTRHPRARLRPADGLGRRAGRRRCRRRASRSGSGTSGGGSNDAGHLLADARLAMQVAPLAGRPLSGARRCSAGRPPGPPPGSGRPELGRLTPGARGRPVLLGRHRRRRRGRRRPAGRAAVGGRPGGGRGTSSWPAGWWCATASWWPGPEREIAEPAAARSWPPATEPRLVVERGSCAPRGTCRSVGPRVSRGGRGRRWPGRGWSPPPRP